MKLRTLEYRIESQKAGEVGLTVTASHPDGETHQFHVCPLGNGQIGFISRDIITRMRAGDSAGARGLSDSYRAIFAVHASGIEAESVYRFSGL